MADLLNELMAVNEGRGFSLWLRPGNDGNLGEYCVCMSYPGRDAYSGRPSTQHVWFYGRTPDAAAKKAIKDMPSALKNLKFEKTEDAPVKRRRDIL